jgi:putative PIN family toxin of toxin-antitoxin system
VRIVLDTAILVRGQLIQIVESEHTLLVSSEMLYELGRVLRYPRMVARHGLSENGIYDYLGYLREVSEIIVPDPLLITPIRDVNDTVVIQTAILGDADVLCTKDRDFSSLRRTNDLFL